ncbi:hypothetical protein U1Q18_032815, partial [Sarracenia purpurea var. burkii]
MEVEGSIIATRRRIKVEFQSGKEHSRKQTTFSSMALRGVARKRPTKSLAPPL